MSTSTADPGNVHAQLAGALVKSLDGDQAAAIADCRRIAAAAPDWWEARQVLGMLLLGAGPRSGFNLAGGVTPAVDPAAAVAEFDEAIRLRPGNAWFHIYRGMARTMQYFRGDQRRELLDGCLTDYDFAVALAPDLLNAHTSRLQANHAMQRTKVVQEELAILRRTWPKDPFALRTRAKIEVPAGRGKALLAEVEAALVELPNSAALQKLREELGGKVADPAPPEPSVKDGGKAADPAPPKPSVKDSP